MSFNHHQNTIGTETILTNGPAPTINLRHHHQPDCLPASCKQQATEPFFEFINTMLMDETISQDVECCSPSWPLQQSFLNIFNGFNQILEQPRESVGASHQSTSSCTIPIVAQSNNTTDRHGWSSEANIISHTTNNCMDQEDPEGMKTYHDSELQYTDGAISTTIVYPTSGQPPVSVLGHVMLPYLSNSKEGRVMKNISDGISTNINSELYAQISRNCRSDIGKLYHDSSPWDVIVHTASTDQSMSFARPNGRRYPWEVNKPTGRGSSANRAMGRWRPRQSMNYSSDGELRDEEVSFIQNEDLRAEALSRLHNNEWSPSFYCREYSSDTKPCRTGGVPDAASFGDEALNHLVDLRALLMKCARAMADGDVRKANQLLSDVQRNGASPQGSGLQRVAFYFNEALQARMSGTGSSLMYPAAILPAWKQPSLAEVLKAYKRVEFEACPYIKVTNYFANQHILDVAEGASRLHIVDYGIAYGFQWPCLISALAHRKGGPTFLKITGIDLPTKTIGKSPAEAVEQTGRRLAKYARAYGVPFAYHGVVATSWEDIDAESLCIVPQSTGEVKEVLAINTVNRLRHLLDESTSSSSSSSLGKSHHKYSSRMLNYSGELLLQDHQLRGSDHMPDQEGGVNLEGFGCPRDKVLARMRQLQPDLLVTGFVNAAHSSPFFVPRFKEALYYYASRFDALHNNLPGENAERSMVEREFLGKEILNVVACEGAERVERPETYKKWQARIQRAGFEALPVPSSVLSTSRTILDTQFHKEFDVFLDEHGPDGRWMLMGWKGRPVQAMSAWKLRSL